MAESVPPGSLTIGMSDYRSLVTRGMQSDELHKQVSEMKDELKKLRDDNDKLSKAKRKRRPRETKQTTELSFLIQKLTKNLSPSEKKNKGVWLAQVLPDAKKADELSKAGDHYWENYVFRKGTVVSRKRKGNDQTDGGEPKKKQPDVYSKPSDRPDVMVRYDGDQIDGEKDFGISQAQGPDEFGDDQEGDDSTDFDNDIGIVPFNPSQSGNPGDVFVVNENVLKHQSFQEYVKQTLKQSTTGEEVTFGTIKATVVLKTPATMLTDDAQLLGKHTQTFLQQDVTIVNIKLPKVEQLPTAKYATYLAYQLLSADVEVVDIAKPTLVVQQEAPLVRAHNVKTLFCERIFLVPKTITDANYPTYADQIRTTDVNYADLKAGNYKEFYDMTCQDPVADNLLLFRSEAVEDASIGKNGTGVSLHINKMSSVITSAPALDTKFPPVTYDAETTPFAEETGVFTLGLVSTKSATWLKSDHTADPKIAQADYFGFIDLSGRGVYRLKLEFQYAQLGAGDYKTLTGFNATGKPVTLNIFDESTPVTARFYTVPPPTVSEEHLSHNEGRPLCVPQTFDHGNEYIIAKPKGFPTSSPEVTIELGHADRQDIESDYESSS